MTEQPDTAAIRASLDKQKTIGPLRTYDLCDALDDARTDRDACSTLAATRLHRAEAAELERDLGYIRSETAEARAEAAEARIADALDALNSADAVEYRIRNARRALTGGTE